MTNKIVYPTAKIDFNSGDLVAYRERNTTRYFMIVLIMGDPSGWNLVDLADGLARFTSIEDGCVLAIKKHDLRDMLSSSPWEILGPCEITIKKRKS